MDSHYSGLLKFNLCKRKCNTFARHNCESKTRCHKESLKGQVCCHCGDEQGQHDNTIIIDCDKWNHKDHTTTQPITSEDYGSHSLSNSGPKFVRCDIETPLQTIKDILLDAWKINPPQLLVSIVGGAKYFRLSERLQEKFCDAVIHAVQKAKAWLFTNGFDIGITQIMGQTLHKIRLTNPGEDITAIAVTKYGCISNYSSLIKRADQKTHGPRHSAEHNLEMHHSHYILLDDGTKYRYGHIEEHLSAIMDFVSQGQDSQEFTIPAVTLAVEGGSAAIKSIDRSLRYSIPVILINGSGRIADFFVRWLRFLKDEPGANDLFHNGNTETIMHSDTKPIDSNDSGQGSRQKSTSLLYRISIDLRRSLSNKHEESWLEKDRKKLDAKVQEILPTVLNCLQPGVRSNLFSFNLNSDDDLTDTILEIICNTHQKQRELNNRGICRTTSTNMNLNHIKKENEANNITTDRNQDEKPTSHKDHMLRLALQWDCLEVAKNSIVRGFIGDIENQEAAILTTLKENLPAFLHYFITINIPLSKLMYGIDIDCDQIRVDASTYNKKFMKTLYSYDFIKRASKTSGGLLKTIIEHHKDLHIKRHEFSTKELNVVLEKLIGNITKNIYPTQSETNNQSDVDSENSILNPQNHHEKKKDIIFRDLFIWAILMNSIDIAKLLLAHISHRICAALIARKIYDSYIDIYMKGDDKKNEYMQSMEYFEKYAIDCIAVCYNINSKQACEIVLRQSEMFGNVTCLEVAIGSDAKGFLGQPCCIRAMDNVWFRTIDAERTTLFNSQRISAEPQENKLEPYGLTYSNRRERQEIKCFTRDFYQSPVVKFRFAFLHYFILLLLFSYVALFKFNPIDEQTPCLDWTEFLLIILVSSTGITELRLWLEIRRTSGRKFHFVVFFQWLTVVCYFLFYLALVLRLVLKEPNGNFVFARIFMGYALQLWWFRALEYVIVWRFLGPHLVAILKMLQDLAFFACVIIVMVFGYGTASRSIAHYGNVNFTTNSVFHDIIFPAYYMMYSEVNDELHTLNKSRDKMYSLPTHFLLAVNMLFIVVLLLNLLIALFNKRFDKVHMDAKDIWHYLRCLLVREYFHRSAIPPPFSALRDLCNIIRMFYDWTRSVRNLEVGRQGKVFKMVSENPTVIKSWDEFEEASTYTHAHAAIPFKKGTILHTVQRKDTDSPSNYSIDENAVDNTSKNNEDNMKLLHELNLLNNEITNMKNTLDYVKTKVDQLEKPWNIAANQQVAENDVIGTYV